MANGMLLQPYVRVEAGDVNLSYFDIGGGEMEYLVHSVSVNLSKGEKSAPTCNFKLAATPVGFEWFSNGGRELFIKEPFTITFGFPGGSEFPTTYAYAGLSLDTGMSPSITIDGTSAIKGTWTDNKISFTMEDEMSLLELPDFLKKKAGKGGELLNFVWAGGTQEDASKVMIKMNRINQTPHVILTEQLKEHGMRVTTQDTAMDGTVVIDYSPGKQGELEKDKPEVAEKGGDPKAGQRRVFILGPGLIDTISRKQKLNLGQASTGGAEGTKSTVSTETEQKDSAQKGILSQQSSAQSSNLEGGTGPADKAKANSETTVPSPNSKEARAALTKMLSTSMSANFPMLPNMVGIKPRDMVVVPSMKAGGYMEDYEVTSVKYDMDNNGGVKISISGERPFTGDENMLDASSIASIRSICDSLTTADSWNAFYWGQGPEVAWALAG